MDTGGDTGVDTGVDTAPDAPPPCTTCQLLAIEPSIANAGDTITLEGTFASNTTVNFPGAVSMPATVLGAHRATAVVPAGATAGELTVTTGTMTVGPLLFRRASFALGLESFSASDDQASGAQQMPMLVTSRQQHTSVVVGNFVYVIGGAHATTALNTVERAMIYSDGSLGPFSTQSTTLMFAREGHTSVAVAGYVYVIGGEDGTGQLVNTTERAAIAADGSLGPFEVVASSPLVTARSNLTSVVIGNSVYVLGGNDVQGATFDTVERAIVASDGTLGAFAIVAHLSVPRSFLSAVVVANTVYALAGDMTSVDAAPIQPDGTLGAFAIVPGVALSSSRGTTSAVAFGANLYVVGGFASTLDSVNTIDIAPIHADGSLGPFATAPTSLTTARQRLSIALIGTYLYAIGGQDGSSLATVERAAINASGAIDSFVSNGGLVTARASHTNVVIANRLYVLGGETLTSVLDSTESAPIYSDGTLGAFTTVSGSTLTTARRNHTSALIGSFLYIIGGVGNAGVLNSIERATVQDDGSLGPFSTVSAIALSTARQGHVCVVIGSFVYVLGGYDNNNNVLNTIERAPINADGTLGAFSAVTGNSLVVARAYFTSAVIGNFLYVLGAANSVERAAINADGSLGPFTTVSGVTLDVSDYSSAVIGSNLYVIAGRVSNVSNLIKRAPINTDGTLGPFATISSTVSTPRSGHTSAVAGNNVYVLGGGGDLGAILGTVEQAPLR